jgi:hypothetical protein
MKSIKIPSSVSNFKSFIDQGMKTQNIDFILDSILEDKMNINNKFHLCLVVGIKGEVLGEIHISSD